MRALRLIDIVDIDELSLRYAQSNVEQNGLTDRISIVSSPRTGPILFPFTIDKSSYVSEAIFPRGYRAHD